MKTGLPFASDMTVLYVDKADSRVKAVPEDEAEFKKWMKLFKNVYENNKMYVKSEKAPDAIYVKNIRVSGETEGLTLVPHTSANVPEDSEDTEALAAKEELEKRIGENRACVVDWEDLVHRRLPLPLKGTVKLGAGETLRFEFPGSSMNQSVPYRVRSWVKGPIVGPLEEKLEKTVKKGKREFLVVLFLERKIFLLNRELICFWKRRMIFDLLFFSFQFPISLLTST